MMVLAAVAGHCSALSRLDPTRTTRADLLPALARRRAAAREDGRPRRGGYRRRSATSGRREGRRREAETRREEGGEAPGLGACLGRRDR